MKNLFIEGDNLDALYYLRKDYLNKIKMIYIDPPYNTKVRKQYKDKRGGNEWRDMIYPRLALAKDLMRDDGVIFISIDDHEQHRLRLICDEIFGEENFVAQFSWRRRCTANCVKKNFISTDHEYIICYARSANFKFKGNKKDIKSYTNPDNDPRGPWKKEHILCSKTQSESPTLCYPITDPMTGITYPCSIYRVRRFSQKTMQKKIEDKEIIFPAGGVGGICVKKFLKDNKSEYNPLSSWVERNGPHFSFPMNVEAANELRELMGGRKLFNYPKSTRMVGSLIDQTTQPDDLILDFFAGSCTTAHAVMKRNKEDGGNRKFIMVQLPEPFEEKSDTFKAGYKNIAELGKDRIRRAARELNVELEMDIVVLDGEDLGEIKRCL